MKWFVETTQYADAKSANGVYLLSDDKSKLYAFKSQGGKGDTQVFKNPIRIDVRGRKFALSLFQYPTTAKEPEPAGRVWYVKGSRGDQYKVTEDRGEWNCTCSGWKFRGQCRHVAELQAS
jgi:flagellin-like hook-associated protein FlgL